MVGPYFGLKHYIYSGLFGLHCSRAILGGGPSTTEEKIGLQFKNPGTAMSYIKSYMQ